MRKYFSEGKKGKSGKTPTTPREKALAAKYGNKKVIATPRVDNKKPKDKQPVTGTRSAKKQKKVTWY